MDTGFQSRDVGIYVRSGTNDSSRNIVVCIKERGLTDEFSGD